MRVVSESTNTSYIVTEFCMTHIAVSAIMGAPRHQQLMKALELKRQACIICSVMSMLYQVAF